MNIIIGCGIAGLVTAYRLQQRGEQVTLFDRSDHIGGRLLSGSIDNIIVPLGAGAGKYPSDYRLYNLCKELECEVTMFESEYRYASEIHTKEEAAEIRDIIIRGIENLSEEEQRRITFRHFVECHIPPSLSKKIRDYVIYNDCWTTNCWSLLHDYQDLFSVEGMNFIVDWEILVDKLADKIGRKNIHLYSECTNIADGEVEINYKKYLYKSLILATNASMNISGIPEPLLETVSYLKPIAIIRVYCTFDEKQAYENGITKIDTALDKIICMDNNLYLIYAESWKAKIVRNMIENGLLQCLLSNNGFDQYKEMIYQYWDVGVHQWMQKPETIVYSADNIHLVGEYVSDKQRSIEGALESVERFLKTLS